MRRLAAVLSLLAVLTASGTLWAHEGPHKVMGTVTVADAKHLEVKTTAGKTVSVLITKDTKYLKGTAAAAAADVKVGARVVVDATEGENEQLTAKEVRLGESQQKGESPEHKH